MISSKFSETNITGRISLREGEQITQVEDEIRANGPDLVCISPTAHYLNQIWVRRDLPLYVLEEFNRPILLPHIVR
jgi:hypothetical protein